MEFDDYDIRLLNALQTDARMTSAELAEHVHLSASQCQRRQKRLEENGVIDRYTALLNSHLVGFDIMAIVSITLEKQAKFPADAFRDTVEKYPQILECWAVTGDADYVMKVVAQDLNAFTAFLMDELLSLSIIGSVKSSILLREVKSTTALPVGRSPE